MLDIYYKLDCYGMFWCAINFFTSKRANFNYNIYQVHVVCACKTPNEVRRSFTIYKMQTRLNFTWMFRYTRHERQQQDMAVCNAKHSKLCTDILHVDEKYWCSNISEGIFSMDEVIISLEAHSCGYLHCQPTYFPLLQISIKKMLGKA